MRKERKTFLEKRKEKRYFLEKKKRKERKTF
jgi:hypothetical protein